MNLVADTITNCNCSTNFIAPPHTHTHTHTRTHIPHKQEQQTLKQFAFKMEILKRVSSPDVQKWFYFNACQSKLKKKKKTDNKLPSPQTRYFFNLPPIPTNVTKSSLHIILTMYTTSIQSVEVDWTRFYWWPFVPFKVKESGMNGNFILNKKWHHSKL